MRWAANPEPFRRLPVYRARSAREPGSQGARKPLVLPSYRAQHRPERKGPPTGAFRKGPGAGWETIRFAPVYQPRMGNWSNMPLSHHEQAHKWAPGATPSRQHLFSPCSGPFHSDLKGFPPLPGLAMRNSGLTSQRRYITSPMSRQRIPPPRIVCIAFAYEPSYHVRSSHVPIWPCLPSPQSPSPDRIHSLRRHANPICPTVVPDA